MTRLSVNVNKIAVLRNSRGGNEPDVCAAASACLLAGAAGITVHPRPDQRHIRPDDVRALKARIGNAAEYNIEGNGFAPARGSIPVCSGSWKRRGPRNARSCPTAMHSSPRITVLICVPMPHA